MTLYLGEDTDPMWHLLMMPAPRLAIVYGAAASTTVVTPCRREDRATPRSYDHCARAG